MMQYPMSPLPTTNTLRTIYCPKTGVTVTIEDNDGVMTHGEHQEDALRNYSIALTAYRAQQ